MSFSRHIGALLLLSAAAGSSPAQTGYTLPPAAGEIAEADRVDRDLPLRSRQRPAEPSELRIDRVVQTPSTMLGAHQKLELRFSLEGGSATVPFWPYDPASPNGVAGEEGVTAYAVFRHEDGAEWRQPAFLYRPYRHEIREGRDWIYPEPTQDWMVRFSPNLTGRWTYTIHATERSGSAESAAGAFEVRQSPSNGFVRVSADDPRYFEYENGAPYFPLGFTLPEHFNEPRAKAAPLYAQLAGSGVSLVRLWISSLFGSAWTPYIGFRNQYRGYLPNAGLVPVSAAPDHEPQLAMLMDWDEDGDTGWFEACRLLGRDSLDAVQPETSYLVQAKYAAWGVTGPRDMRAPDFGFVIKEGAWRSCYQPGSGVPITSYGGQNEDGIWRTVSGVWQSRDANFLPPLQIALENVTGGAVFVRSISIRELAADGSLGPEVLSRPSMDLYSYASDKSAYQLDQILALAEQAGVRLKLVLGDKDDEIWLKREDDGSFVTGDDNADGYFGVGRDLNATRWLQRAWWRYAQARWGYSPAIHSWELLNEGDPASPAHFTMADELARYMKYGVFDLTAPETLAGPDPNLHPNAHLVTTSFWHSFPCTELWRNDAYRFLDYADLHAYVSTSYAGLSERQAMQNDAALYHLWHSASTADCGAGKPVIRGEAGLDSPNSQSPTVLGLHESQNRLWLHNFVWSTLDSGAMGEIYWWTSHLTDGDTLALQPFRVLAGFLADTALNRGGFSDWGGTVTDEALRVVGQKNAAAGRAHLWIQNRNSTWARDAAGEAGQGVSASAVLTGFEPGSSYRAEYWDTRSAASTSAPLRADQDGSLSIPVQDLVTDVAVKVYPETNP